MVSKDCKANFFTEVFPFILQAAGHLDVESFELKKLDQGVEGLDVFSWDLQHNLCFWQRFWRLLQEICGKKICRKFLNYDVVWRWGVHLGGEAKKLEKNKPSGFESKTLEVATIQPRGKYESTISTRYPPLLEKCWKMSMIMVNPSQLTSTSGVVDRLFLPRELVLTLLAHMFLCTITDIGPNMPHAGFEAWLRNMTPLMVVMVEW